MRPRMTGAARFHWGGTAKAAGWFLAEGVLARDLDVPGLPNGRLFGRGTEAGFQSADAG